MQGSECSHALSQAITMLASDRPSKKVDALFLFASTPDHTGLFELVGELRHPAGFSFVYINGADGGHVEGRTSSEMNSVKEFYLTQLMKRGISRSRICIAAPAFNIVEENDAFLKLAVSCGAKSALLVTQPHQIIRAFLGQICAMRRRGVFLRIHATIPNRTSWQEVVDGSEECDPMPRSAHIEQEFSRVAAGQREGQLAAFDELFDYLRRRDTGEFDK